MSVDVPFLTLESSLSRSHADFTRKTSSNSAPTPTANTRTPSNNNRSTPSRRTTPHESKASRCSDDLSDSYLPPPPPLANFRVPPSPDQHNLEEDTAALLREDTAADPSSADSDSKLYKIRSVSAPVNSFHHEYPHSPASNNTMPLPGTFSSSADFSWQRPLTEAAGHTPFAPRPSQHTITENYGFVPFYPFGRPFESNVNAPARPSSHQDASKSTLSNGHTPSLSERDTVELNSSKSIDSLPSSPSTSSSLVAGDTGRKPESNASSRCPSRETSSTMSAAADCSRSHREREESSRSVSAAVVVPLPETAHHDSQSTAMAPPHTSAASVNDGVEEEKSLLSDKQQRGGGSGSGSGLLTVAPPTASAAAADDDRKKLLKASNSSSRLSAMLTRENSTQSIKIKSAGNADHLKSILVNSPLYLKQRGFDSIMKVCVAVPDDCALQLLLAYKRSRTRRNASNILGSLVKKDHIGKHMLRDCPAII